MMASLDPLGLPLAVDIVSGNRADDPLYIPSYQRVKQILEQEGLLVFGDSKMSALLTRGTIAASDDYYLVPLADQKDEPELRSELLAAWLERGAEAMPIFLPEDRPSDGSEPELRLAIGGGFEVTRPQSVLVGDEEQTWDERLLVVRSYSYQKSILAGLRRRLEKAERALVALTPPRRRGKQQIETEGQLLSAIAAIEKQYQVKGFFDYAYQQEVAERTIRAYKSNPPRVERKVRYQLTVKRNQPAIADAEFAAGWRIYATNAPAARLPLEEAVLVYRGQITQENIFRRLNGKMLSITPLYVQREDHAQGLVHLLTLGSRLLALGDFLAKKALAQEGAELAGIYAGNPKRSTPRPTTERMLKAFEGIDLVILPQGERNIAILTALQPVHERILALLGLQNSLFSALQSV
jgi:transposase